ncbi:MAG: isoprenylcysteine carboxylmethyltransferase family protein [Planctomycetales bacterium]|nr:isoprenylcysteine carboxylmethyltransferase family protein [Planctomycetales bacterium]
MNSLFAQLIVLPTREKTLAVGIVALCAVIQLRVYRRHRPVLSPEDSAQQLPSCAIIRPAIRFAKPFVSLLLVGSLCVGDPWMLIWHQSVLWRWIGVGMSVGGIVLFMWAMRSLGAAYRPCSAVVLPESIVTHGPYRWLRHPIYLSNEIYMLGIGLATGSAWMALPLIVFGLVHLYQARREERQLAEGHPQYRDYQRRTRWFGR